MNVSFEYYRIFYVVAKTGNITKAADELMISKKDVKKSLKKLVFTGVLERGNNSTVENGYRFTF